MIKLKNFFQKKSTLKYCKGGINVSVLKGAVGFFIIIFLLKVLDNIFDASRVILLQKNHSILAGVCLSCSAFLNYYVIKIIAKSDGLGTMTVAAIAAGVGCCLAGVIGTRFLHGNYVDVIMSDDIEAIKEIHGFLTEEHIKHKVEETYNKDLTEKTLTITAFSDTLAKNRKLKKFIENSEKKFGHIILQ